MKLKMLDIMSQNSKYAISKTLILSFLEGRKHIYPHILDFNQEGVTDLMSWKNRQSFQNMQELDPFALGHSHDFEILWRF